MFLIMTILAFLFVCGIIFCCEMQMRSFLEISAEEMRQLEEQSGGHERQIGSLLRTKETLEDEAEEIFKLYDMTRAITKNFDEQEMFEVFKLKLTENIVFEDCFLFGPLASPANGMKALKDSPDTLFFNLQSKEQKLGVLVFTGLQENDREKVTILGHQFALALRRIRLYQEVERLAMTDSLTEVSTRRYFMERFGEELNRAKNRKSQLTFLMIDVDHFKKFNDQYGHMVGDQILRRMGEIIKENIREIDIAGRYGGEEFCVVLPDTDEKGGTYVAERIRAATEKTQIRSYDAKVNITISIGLASFPKSGHAPQELIQKADKALYKAKEAGRNRVLTAS